MAPMLFINSSPKYCTTILQKLGDKVHGRVDHTSTQRHLFLPNEKKAIITYTTCWMTMVVVPAGLTWFMGPLQMFKLYDVPYWIFFMWLDLVTYLHHHRHEEKLPWYYRKEWSYIRGLTTLDHDFGCINNIHLDVGTHVIHCPFPQIPHYHLIEATEATKPVHGKYYKEQKESGPLPFHLLGVLMRSLRHDHNVSDIGDVVYYHKDPELYSSVHKSS